MTKITCPLSSHQDHLDGKDMGDVPGFVGFTIGKGWRLYELLTWCSSGHAFVYYQTPDGLVRRWVNGDSTITIHIEP